jgi:hypothetical protein
MRVLSVTAVSVFLHDEERQLHLRTVHTCTCMHMMQAHPPACVVACEAFSWHVPDDTVTRVLALAGRLASLLPSAQQPQNVSHNTH